MKTCFLLAVIPTSVWLPLIITAAALSLLAFLWKRMTLYVFSRLEYRREFSDGGVFEGDRLQLIETLINPTPFPIFFVDAEAYVYSGLEFADYIPETDNNMQYMVSRFTLMPYMKIRRKHNIDGRRRGYYRLESAQLWKGKNNRYVESVADVYIYPKMLDPGFLPRPLSVLQGNNVSSRRLISDPFSFAGIRDYRFGDSMSSINFKASAKAPVYDYSGIKVNERDFCSNRSIMIYINFQTDTEEPLPTKIYSELMENALSYASELIYEAISEGYRVGLSANCRSMDASDKLMLPMLSGNDHYLTLLKALSTARTEAGASVLALFEKDLQECVSSAEFYFMTAHITDEIHQKIAALERYSNTVNIIKLSEDFGKYE